jgi:hypothetical protein
MPEGKGVEAFVRQLFISETARTNVQNVGVKTKRAKLRGESSEVISSGIGEAGARLARMPRR